MFALELILQPRHRLFRDNLASVSTLGLIKPASCKKLSRLDTIYIVLELYLGASSREDPVKEVVGGG